MATERDDQQPQIMHWPPGHSRPEGAESGLARYNEPEVGSEIGDHTDREMRTSSPLEDALRDSIMLTDGHNNIEQQELLDIAITGIDLCKNPHQSSVLNNFSATTNNIGHHESKSR